MFNSLETLEDCELVKVIFDRYLRMNFLQVLYRINNLEPSVRERREMRYIYVNGRVNQIDNLFYSKYDSYILFEDSSEQDLC